MVQKTHLKGFLPAEMSKETAVFLLSCNSSPTLKLFSVLLKNTPSPHLASCESPSPACFLPSSRKSLRKTPSKSRFLFFSKKHHLPAAKKNAPLTVCNFLQILWTRVDLWLAIKNTILVPQQPTRD